MNFKLFLAKRLRRVLIMRETSSLHVDTHATFAPGLDRARNVCASLEHARNVSAEG